MRASLTHLPLVLLASALAVVGCSAYERTNPLDPALELGLAITGPDSIFSLTETAQYQLSVHPDYANLPFGWSSSDAGRLAPQSASPGAFTAVGNGIVTIRAKYGPHIAEKVVVVSQKPVRLRIPPPASAEIESLGAELNLSAAIVDARNAPLPAGGEGVVWEVSNPQVLGNNNGRVVALANGESWVRATKESYSDSLLIRVRQVPRSLGFSSSSFAIGFPGGSVQTGLAARDARNNPIVNPAGLVVTSSRSSFTVSTSGVVQSSAYGSTTITATLGELVATTQVRVSGGSAPTVTGVAAGVLAVPGLQSLLLAELDTRDSELDLDEATVEVYSTENTWLATRFLPLQQGVATYSTEIAISGLGTAGTLRIRLRDAALNNTGISTWNVVSQPRAGSPSIELQNVTGTLGGEVFAVTQMTRGGADLRSAYILLFGADGAVLKIKRVPAPPGGGALVLSISTSDQPAARWVGVVTTDTSGNFSAVRLTSLPAAS